MSCTTCPLNYDNAPCIPVIGKENTSLHFSVTYPDEIDISQGDIKLVIAEDERGECVVLTILEDEGLTRSGQVLHGDISVAQNILTEGQYYGEVRHDIDDDNAGIILKIQFEIRPTIARSS